MEDVLLVDKPPGLCRFGVDWFRDENERPKGRGGTAEVTSIPAFARLRRSLMLFARLAPPGVPGLPFKRGLVGVFPAISGAVCITVVSFESLSASCKTLTLTTGDEESRLAGNSMPHWKAMARKRRTRVRTCCANLSIASTSISRLSSSIVSSELRFDCATSEARVERISRRSSASIGNCCKMGDSLRRVSVADKTDRTHDMIQAVEG